MELILDIFLVSGGTFWHPGAPFLGSGRPWGHPAAHVGVQMYFSTFFCQFWVPLGTYLEVILLAFPAVGHPFCLWASWGVVFSVLGMEILPGPNA